MRTPEEERERHRLKAARYRELHPEKARAANDRSNQKIKETRDRKVRSFLVAQGDRCAICGTTEMPEKGWQLDHDHDCCKQRLAHRRCGRCDRGVLCTSCNTALGFFRDDPKRLWAAIRYLRTWGKT